MKILCIGQSAYDITLPVSKYPEENKKYRIHNQLECGGGSSNNAAYLLASWGNEVYLISSIGKDSYGKKIKEELESVGVDTSLIKELDGVFTTTSYIINNMANGSRTILTNRSKLIKYPQDIALSFTPDIIFLDGNEYEISMEIVQKYPQAIKIIDAGSLKEETIKLCAFCDYIVCSNDFAKDYTKIDFDYHDQKKVQEVYDKIANDFSGKLIITLEAMGSFIKRDNEYYLIPSINVECIDSTGAGDIYHGAFTHFIAHQFDILDAMRLANIAGALSVTKMGGKMSMPSLAEVIRSNEL